jgi:hypothetical protein
VVDVVGPAQCPARFRWPKKKRKKAVKSKAEIMEEELASFV